MRIQFFVLIFLLPVNLIFSEELKNDDRIVLEKFLKTTFYESEFGYVYFGLKPVCWIGYWMKDTLRPGIIRHKNEVIYKEGMKVWEECDFPQSEALHVFTSQSGYDENMKSLFFINRKLLEKTIDDNLTLFQYVLGHNVTAKKLIREIENPNTKFADVLKKDNVLIGIILGFGANNAIAVSRSERIVNEFSEYETPPISPLYIRLESESESDVTGFFESQKNMLLSHKKTLPSWEGVLAPSFGWENLSNEFSFLSQNTIGSSDKLMNNKPWFVFGRMKNCKQSEKFVGKLEKAQDKIQQFLNKPSFASEVVKTITGKIQPGFLSNPSHSQFLPLSPTEKSYLPKIIAESIFYIDGNESNKFFEGFIKGMEDCDLNIPMKEMDRRVLALISFDKIKNENLVEAKKNLAVCTTIFEKLKNDPEQTEIIPDKLYYRERLSGSGQTLQNETKVLVNYTLTMGPENELLCDTRASGIPRELDLSECIDGLHYGLIGMKEGGEREIMIHPDFGYGLYTMLDSNQYIKATVTLHKIDSQESFEKIPEPIPLEVATEIPDDLEQTCQKKQWEAGYYSGYQNWSHYKRCDDYTLDQVISALRYRLSGEAFEFPSSIDPNRTINRLHWNIYAQEDYQLKY